MDIVELNLYRHGHTNRNDTQDIVFGQSPLEPLDDLGLAQAEQLSVYQLDNGLIPDYVVSSPAERALMTARVAVGHLVVSGRLAANFPITADTRLLEQSLGRHEGMSKADVYTDEVRAQLDCELAEYRHPGGESMRDASMRGIDALFSSARFAEQNGFRQVDLYSHNMTIAAILARLEGATSSREMHDHIRGTLLAKRLGYVSRTMVIWENNKLHVEFVGIPTVV